MRPKRLSAKPAAVDPRIGRVLGSGLSKGDLARAKMVEAAIRIIAHEGIASANFNTVGKACGVGRAHVSYYFDSIEEIVEISMKYITEVAQEMTVQRVLKAQTPRERLFAISDGAFDWLAKYPDHLAVRVLVVYESLFQPGLQTLNRQILSVARGRMAEIVASLFTEAGKKASPSKCNQVADSIQSYLTGVIVNYSQEKGRKDLDEVRLEVRESLGHWVDSVISAARE